MSVVLFGVSPGLPEQEVERLLNQVAGLVSVVRAERLTSARFSEGAVRHCVATLDDSVPARQIIDQVVNLPGIEYASKPADRGIIP